MGQFGKSNERQKERLKAWAARSKAARQAARRRGGKGGAWTAYVTGGKKR